MTLDPLYQAIGWLLALFYSVIPNLGVSIILLTITIMLILFPLTAKQAKSMIAMQKLAPELKKLQAKYKGDRQKLNEETMKLYQENKVNPLASCLPLLLQLPIFFALYRVLRDAYKHVPTDSALYHALCNGVKCNSTENVNHLKFLGIDLQKSAVDAHNGFMSAAPYFILVALVVLTGYLQSRQAQKRTPAANKQMAMVTKVLPVFFGLISLQFPAGLVLYFFVSNLWRLGQQEVIFRRFQAGANAPPKPAIGKAGKAGAATAVIDVESRDRNGDRAGGGDDDAADDVGETGGTAVEPAKPRATPPARPAKTRTAPATGSGATEAAPQPAAAEGRRGGGLRGLFAPPPPAEGNGASNPSGARPKPVKPAPSKSAPGSGTSSTSGRPGQAGRRTSNKKRKRKR
jgi:YidC/Oxa1 family membrane protein insertase